MTKKPVTRKFKRKTAESETNDNRPARKRTGTGWSTEDLRSRITLPRLKFMESKDD